MRSMVRSGDIYLYMCCMPLASPSTKLIDNVHLRMYPNHLPPANRHDTPKSTSQEVNFQQTGLQKHDLQQSDLHQAELQRKGLWQQGLHRLYLHPRDSEENSPLQFCLP